ncbi:glycoside hydrolase family 31 protein [Pseudenhygromyxa sp. WMMC2535]|uniref:glycoside hydrolase family 31 protein n=1 Tax=Pseudenhygromyxa sp. WMMC2535 TaxID=2712867 RepID=UPI0015575D2E|nr:glycoside hydrolase family 31 protein [Pseudenhygromyxa sp. WMMC2535]NVB37428.1 glycoside hydrolase family 31 protein [Pseudenhygromyxa sp. WMMC2535]
MPVPAGSPPDARPKLWPILCAGLLACAGDPAADGQGETEDDLSDIGGSSEESEGGPEPDPDPEPITLAWDEAGPELALLRGETVLLRFPADAFLLGEVAAIVESSSYDPAFVEPAAWRAVESAETIEAGPTRVEATLIFEGGARTQLVVEEQAAGRFAATWIPADEGEGEGEGSSVAMLRLAPVVDSEEGFYGLGEVFDSPEHRGRTRALQLEYDAALESANNEAHVPVPFITGTNGWGLYLADDHAMVFDVAQSDADRLRATVGTGPDSGAGLQFHLFAADHPLDIAAHYYALTGTPHRPAPWALGPWIWRDENEDQAEVLADMQTLRALDLATSGIWVDRPYASGVNSFDFDAAPFPAPQAMIDEAHALGLRFALWHTPYLDPNNPAVASLREQAELMGLFPPESALLTSSWGEPIDFSNADAFDWWQAQIQLYTDMGVEGFKLDYGEDVTVGLNGLRTTWAFADGSSERTMHKGYPRLYHRAYQELLPAEGGFLLARAGSAGDQVNVDVIWPGDLDATMTTHGESFEIDGQVYAGVGGLPAAVVAGSSLGPSGFPLFASDTGGYRHAPPSPETFARWFEHTALTPVMQIGTNSNDVAWDFDDEILASYRALTRLHMRLFPYLWTEIEDLATDGRAIVRPLGLAYPELGVHPRYDYMLGDALLCAPVVEAGASERALYLPPGRWVHWFTGEVFENPGPGALLASVDAPLGRPPLLLRAGDIVAMLRPTIDSLAPTTAPGTAAGEVDSYATDPGPLTIRTTPGASREAALFDGTTVHTSDAGASFEVALSPGAVFVQGVEIEVIAMDQAPTGVHDQDGAIAQVADASALAAAERGWLFVADELGGQLRIKLEAGERSLVIER